MVKLLLALSLTGFGLFPALAQTVSGEGDATSAQIAVLPGQTLRNYAPWDPATSDVPALPLPADINADTGAISGGSNPASLNVFRTRVFDLDFTGVTIPPCPDGSPATNTNVVITMQFTGDQSNGSGVDLFARVFTNGDTVLDGVDLVGDDVFGTQVIKFKQLVPVADLDTAQLLVSFQTLEGTIQFNWSMDILGVDLAPDCPVTGDAELDFPLGSPNTAVAYDPGFLDVSVDPGAPEGTISGFDAIDVRFRLDEIDDLMYVAINTDGVGGDADGNGDPTTTAAWMANNGGSDSPDYGVNEAVVVILDIDTDGVPDVVAGVPYSQSINEYSVALLGAGNPLSNFGAPLPSHTGEVLNNPGDGTTPDLIFTITNWSTLPTSGVDADERSFSYVMFQGSTGDLAMGEEWSPGIAEFGPVVIPPEVSDLGSIGNLVWFDTDGDGVFDEGEESGIPGVVVLLLDADGNEIGQQITDADGGYLFTDLPMGVYTVEIADSNFDDCGDPIYKSGKWALDGGLEFGGSNTVFETNIPAVGSDFTLAAYIHSDTAGQILSKGTAYRVTRLSDGDIKVILNRGLADKVTLRSNTPLMGAGHVAVTYDGTTLKLYINGVLDKSKTASLAWNDVQGNLLIGDNFEGTINDVRIYDSVLDAAAIEALASMECGALADLHQTTVIGGVADNTNKATPFQYGLAEGEDYLGADFGYNELGSIGNTVWCEEDGDGFFEPQNGEMGIPGVEVILKDGSGTVIATAVTDQDGQYLFDDLPAGNYTVEVALGGANVECTPALTSIDNVSSGNTYNIAREAGVNDLFYSDRAYTIYSISSGIDGLDLIQTANDDGYAANTDLLTFTLAADSEVYLAFYNCTPVPAWVAAEGWTLTSEVVRITDGNCVWTYNVYSKTLSAGQHTLDGTDPCAAMYGVFVDGELCGPLAGKEPTLARNSDPGDGASRTSPHSVNLGPGQDYILADFGYVIDEPDICIGDLVFYDCDGDGYYEPGNGEYGICGVKIVLKDSNGYVVAVTHTDSSGRYVFEGLAPGCYSVCLDSINYCYGYPLYGYTQVVDRSNLSTDDVNRCLPLCVCVADGDCYLKADFGFRNNCLYYYNGCYSRYNSATGCWESYNGCCWVLN